MVVLASKAACASGCLVPDASCCQRESLLHARPLPTAELQPGTVTSADVGAVLHQLGLPFAVAPARDERNHVGSEADLRLVLRFLAQVRRLRCNPFTADPVAAAAGRTCPVSQPC